MKSLSIDVGFDDGCARPVPSPVGPCGTGDPRLGQFSVVTVPLYQVKADLFRTLGHPVRIRVLELLQDGPRPVHELLDAIDVESSNLSQQLGVLRRAGMVTSSRKGSTVVYTLSTADVAELLRVARRILEAMITGQDELLAALRLPLTTR